MFKSEMILVWLDVQVTHFVWAHRFVTELFFQKINIYLVKMFKYNLNLIKI